MDRAKKIRATAFDIMQYFYGAVHEPLIHCMISFSGRVDEAALKRAVSLSQRAVLLLGCSFDAAGWRPCWRQRGFGAEDIVRVVSAGPDERAQAENLLAQIIDIAGGPQLRIYLIRGRAADTLCIIINHMVCDGAGFKEYLYMLCALYTGGEGDAGSGPGHGPAPRGAGQLFAGMSLARRLKIMVLKYDVSSQKEQKPYPLEGDAENPFFVTRRLAADGFLALKAHAKSRGASVNDMFLTAYIRALHLRTGEERIVMPCPVDLRRFIPQGRSHGICNLTSNLICDVRVGGGDTFDETLSQVSGQMRLRKESLSSLKSVVLLGLIVHLVPFQLLRRIFGRLFTIPVVSYTNLGVIDSGRLHFGGVGVTDAFLTGAVKYVPYFQLAFSTFGDVCTLSCNLHGTPEDRETIGLFLESLCGELAF